MTDDASGIAYLTVGDGTLVRMWGEVDASLRASASETMAHVLRRPGRVDVDVSGVTFIDSAGLAFVVQLYMVGQDDGRPVVLRDPSAMILDLLDVIGMAGVIPVVRTPEAWAGDDEEPAVANIA